VNIISKRVLLLAILVTMPITCMCEQEAANVIVQSERKQELRKIKNTKKKKKHNVVLKTGVAALAAAGILGACYMAFAQDATSNNNEESMPVMTKKDEEDFFTAVGAGNWQQATALATRFPSLIKAQSHDDGATGLHYAAESAWVDLAAFLIKNNADVNAEDRCGRTPLHYAASAIECDEPAATAMVQCLLANKANVNAYDKTQTTPVHFAAQRNHGDRVVGILVKAGAKVDAKTQDTPVSRNVVATDGQSAAESDLKTLCKATIAGSLDQVKSIVGRNQNLVKAKLPDNGDTAAHYAAGNGHVEILQYLLEQKADPNAPSHDGFTLLHAAAMRGLTSYSIVLNSVKGHGVNIDQKSRSGATAWELALRLDPSSGRNISIDVAIHSSKS